MDTSLPVTGGAGDDREAVAVASRVLDACGVGDLIWGHVSKRDPHGRGFWVKRAGIGLGQVRADDVHLVGWDGAVLEGPAGRHLEWPIHAEVLRARDDVGSVVHTHGRGVLALLATGHPLRPISHEGALFSEPGPPEFEHTTDLIESPVLGTHLARTLADRNAVLMPCHGSVTVGSSVAGAVVTAVLLERACTLQLRALSAGGVTRWSSAQEATAKKRIFDERALATIFEHLCTVTGAESAALLS